MSDLTRVTVNLTQKSMSALRNVSQLNEETKTTAMNQAIQLYDMWCRVEADGGEIVSLDRDGKVRLFKKIR